MEWVISAVLTVVLVALGFVAGSITERRHFSVLANRERDTIDIVRTNSRVFLAPRIPDRAPCLVCAETVVASDYFKNFLSSFRKFFGGEMRSYHSLMERARRETTLRLLEQTREMGFNSICNIRLEPADVGGNVARKGSIMVCILGSATAYNSDIQIEYPGRQPQPPVK